MNGAYTNIGKHTPGPWRLAGGEGKRGELYVWSDRDEEGKGYIGSHEICVAVVQPKARCEGGAVFAEEEIAANAALIKSAPALLAALEKFVAAAKCGYDPAVALEQYGAMAEAALVSARGPEPTTTT